jgi:hypothetical protein
LKSLSGISDVVFYIHACKHGRLGFFSSNSWNFDGYWRFIKKYILNLLAKRYIGFNFGSVEDITEYIFLYRIFFTIVGKKIGFIHASTNKYQITRWDQVKETVGRYLINLIFNNLSQINENTSKVVNEI